MGHITFISFGYCITKLCKIFQIREINVSLIVIPIVPSLLAQVRDLSFSPVNTAHGIELRSWNAFLTLRIYALALFNMIIPNVHWRANFLCVLLTDSFKSLWHCPAPLVHRLPSSKTLHNVPMILQNFFFWYFSFRVVSIIISHRPSISFASF